MSRTMDEEDDDFYDPADTVPATQSQPAAQNAAHGQPQETDEMDEEEVEVEDDEVRRTRLSRACCTDWI